METAATSGWHRLAHGAATAKEDGGTVRGGRDSEAQQRKSGIVDDDGAGLESLANQSTSLSATSRA
jgi:hypothetical protein